jgi:hypothetical protein
MAMISATSVEKKRRRRYRQRVDNILLEKPNPFRPLTKIGGPEKIMIAMTKWSERRKKLFHESDREKESLIRKRKIVGGEPHRYIGRRRSDIDKGSIISYRRSQILSRLVDDEGEVDEKISGGEKKMIAMTSGRGDFSR